MEEPISFQALSEQLSFMDVLDNIDAGIIVFDEHGDFMFMNTVMVNWRNIPRKEYLKMNVHDFNSVLDVCVFDLVCQQKSRVSRLQYYRDLQKLEAGPRVRIVTGTPIFDGQGNIRYVIVMLQDVQDFEERSHQLQEAHRILLGDSGKPVMVEKVSIVAKSAEIRQLLSVAESVAPLDSTVLLYGESGSGKEVFAHYVHDHSRRANGPLITVNCAAFPENLIEAELFGYEKGSFTGASREGKVGLVEAANGGTLFLDEINSLPLSVQGKVLRVIEEKSVQRIGAIRDKKVDFRLVAATNRDLPTLVRQGTFREDLYYRLNVIPLVIPPMRSRKDDIVPLCLHFLHYFCQKYNLQKSFSEEVLEQLRGYAWPGNVREIRNFVERMVVMTPNGTREICSIPEGMLSGAQLPEQTAAVHTAPAAELPSFLPTRRGISPGREEIVAALEASGGRREQAAARLGVSRRYLQYKIKEYHIPSRARYPADDTAEK